MDFPFSRFHKPVLADTSTEAIGTPVTAWAPAWAGGGHPVNNLAIFVPFVLAGSYLVRRLWWANGTTPTGNVDCGVYTAGGTLLLSAGSTAQAVGLVNQVVTLGTPVLLQPGSYYMALAASSTSMNFYRTTGVTADALRNMGVAQQASALPLPATFTLAALASAYLPLFGIASAGVL